MRDEIYLDNQATTAPDPRVVEAMLPYFTEEYGNPSSAHSAGRRAAEAVETARDQVATLIGADSREVIFAAGATEANNLAIIGAARRSRGRRRLVTSPTEHASVLEVAKAVEREGYEISQAEVDSDGIPVDVSLEQLVSDDTLIVSIAAANGEIGTIPEIGLISQVVRERGALMHTDAAQAVGKIPIDVGTLDVDMLSMSAHKLYGPKGIGALFVRREVQSLVEPQVFGGGQEGGLRSGTLNVPAIVGFGVACELAAASMDEEAARTSMLRDRLLDRLRVEIGGLEVNGTMTRRLPGNLNVRLRGVDSEALIARCTSVAFSSGSACSSSTPAPSHVLLAIGLDRDAADESVRFSVGRSTTEEDVDAAAARVVDVVARIRKLSKAAA